MRTRVPRLRRVLHTLHNAGRSQVLYTHTRARARVSYDRRKVHVQRSWQYYFTRPYTHTHKHTNTNVTILVRFSEFLFGRPSAGAERLICARVRRCTIIIYRLIADF